MRLKQLVVVLVPLLFCAAYAPAAETQLKSVTATAQTGSTVVALETAGSFTHSEYRPQPSMVLVDLPGVSPSALKQRERSFDMPEVKGYRVLQYKSVSGIEVTRVELTVAETAKLQVKESKSGLLVSLSSDGAPFAAKPVERVAQAVAPPPVANTNTTMTAASAAAGRTVTIRDVSVVRTVAGLAVEIAGAKSASSLRLSEPDRLVFDIQNSALAGKSRTIEVNAPDLKAIRVSRYQLTPPVTRVVLDLPGPRDFDLTTRGDKLVVTVLPGKGAVNGSASSPASAGRVLATPQSAGNAAGSGNTEQSAPLTVQSLFPAQPGVVAPAPPVQQPIARKEVVAVTPAPLPPPPPVQKPTAQREIAVVPPPPPPVQRSTAQTEIAAVPIAPPPPPPPPPSSTAEKKSDYVFVEPVYKKQDQPAPPTPALNPAIAKASEAAATVGQDHPAPEPSRAKAEVSPHVAVNFALEQQKSNAAPQPQGSRPKYTGEPISVNLKDVDLKDFFRLVHEISGLNIVLDPSVRGTLTLVLDDVPWDQALDVVLQNNGLGRQLEGNVLRIANLDTFRKEAEQQRAQAEAQALAVNKVTVTRFLSYAHAKDLMPTIKKLLTTRGDVLADDRTNALIISDIPSTIPQLDRLLTQLDRKTLEVEIEARVVAATRSFARQLGAQVGFGWGNGAGTAVGGNPTTGTSPNTILGSVFPYFTIPGPQTGGTASPQAIPLFSNLGVAGNTSGLNFVTAVGNYRLDVLLSAAETHGLLKVLSRPRVVTQNNVTAVVRQGVRVPVVTQSQLQGPATTSYVDAFLRLTVTPQITIDNTIFLAVDVENTQPDFSNSVGGNPTLITQQATTQVLVTDGGTVVIGGVILTQNSINVQQVPWLGSVPILGNLFKNRSVSTSTQELMFFISPKIIQT